MEALRHMSPLDLPAAIESLLKVKWASHTVTRGLRNAACGAGLFALLLSSAWAGGDEPILQPSAIASTDAPSTPRSANTAAAASSSRARVLLLRSACVRATPPP